MKILYRILRIKINLINPPATQCPSYAGTKLIEHHVIFYAGQQLQPVLSYVHDISKAFADFLIEKG